MQRFEVQADGFLLLITSCRVSLITAFGGKKETSSSSFVNLQDIKKETSSSSFVNRQDIDR